MPSAWSGGADETITETIRGLLDERAPFITGWVLIATFADDDGDTCTAFNAMPEQRRTATLGMLTHGLEVERANIFWDEKPND